MALVALLLRFLYALRDRWLGLDGDAYRLSFRGPAAQPATPSATSSTPAAVADPIFNASPLLPLTIAPPVPEPLVVSQLPTTPAAFLCGAPRPVGTAPPSPPATTSSENVSSLKALRLGSSDGVVNSFEGGQGREGDDHPAACSRHVSTHDECAARNRGSCPQALHSGSGVREDMRPVDVALSADERQGPCRESAPLFPSLLMQAQRTSLCYCRTKDKQRAIEDGRCLFDNKVPSMLLSILQASVRLYPTLMKPFEYVDYVPLNLVDTEPGEGGLCEAAVSKGSRTPPESFLTPFYPVLHAIAYADRHAAVIQHLIENYEYLG